MWLSEIVYITDISIDDIAVHNSCKQELLIALIKQTGYNKEITDNNSTSE